MDQDSQTGRKPSHLPLHNQSVRNHSGNTCGISNAQPDQAKNARRHLDHQDQERDQAQAAAPPTSKDEEEIPNSEEPTPGGALLCSDLATSTWTTTTDYRLQQQPLTGLGYSGES